MKEMGGLQENVRDIGPIGHENDLYTQGKTSDVKIRVLLSDILSEICFAVT